MAKLIELPSRKIVNRYVIHGHPNRWGWFVRHHYTDGSSKDFDFSFEEAEAMIKHLRSVTVDRLA